MMGVQALSATGAETTREPGARPGIHVYESETCGIRIEYPASWKVVPGLEAKLHYGGDYREPTPCAVGLLPPGWQAYLHSSDVPLSEFPVTVVLKDAELREAAFQADFRRVGDLRRRIARYKEELGADDWVFPFLQSEIPAQWIRTPCCR
ncbi:MAG: hypothetical protein NDJ92_10440, partial [Thermoanaerobaculia bacterium]|nr:hypothetical protein [Thermoanaerobaculia bacterium]